MPEEPATIYEIRIKGESEPIYGYVNDRDWRKSSVKVILDEPWLPAPRDIGLIQTKIEGYQEEWQGGREKRREQQARNAGYQRIGDRYYRAEEIRWAEKARALAAEQELHREGTETAEAPERQAPATQPPEPPGLIRRWGMHAVLVAAALVLVALIAKTMLLA